MAEEMSWDPTRYNITPKPWHLGNSVHEFRDGDTWRIAIWADNADSGDKIAAEAWASDRERARANARLIAASPDLLDSLASIVYELEEHWPVEPGTPMAEKLDEAIRIIAKVGRN